MKPEKLPTTMRNDTTPKWRQYIRAFPAKWRRRSRAERLLLLEAFALLGVARLLTLTIPFRWMAASLGKHMNESDNQSIPADLEQARLISQAVRSAANNTPWKSVCLPRAVAAQWMLKRRRIAATLYLGVTKDDKKPEKLAAHAWLRCGDVILTGAEGHRQFTVVSSFSPDATTLPQQ
jgi:hypothetical protein